MEALRLEPRSEHFNQAFKPAQRSESPRASSGSPSPQNDADDEEESDRDARQLDSKESKPRKPHLQVIRSLKVRRSACPSSEKSNT
jgi:hypothetical protein